MFPLPPLVAAALVACAALLATYLPRPSWLVRLLAGAGTISPLPWYLIGVVFGPMLGLMDRSVQQAITPALGCATGWIAAAAGARAAAPTSRARYPAWTPRELAGVLSAFLIPAALLYGAPKFLPPSIAATWKPIWPLLAVSATAMAWTTTARTSLVSTISLLVSAGAVLALLPHAHRSDWWQSLTWCAFALGGTASCMLVAVRLGRQPKTRPAATITALCLAAGIGLASGTSPFLVCGLLGIALTKWGPGFERLGDELTPTEPTITALVWMAAGALAGGRFPTVYVAALLLALWPALRRRIAPAVPAGRYASGLALVLSFTLTTERFLGAEGTALLTAVAVALLAAALVPSRAPETQRLTSPTRPAEVTA